MNEPNSPSDAPRETQADQDPLSRFSAEELILQFGGIRPMAAKLGVPVTTVQGWKSRGRIPTNRRQAISDAARTHNVDLSADAQRQPPKEPVTITSVPVSVEIEDDGDGEPPENETAADTADTVVSDENEETSAPKTEEVSDSKKTQSAPPEKPGGFPLLPLALVAILLIGGGLYYYKPSLLGLGGKADDVQADKTNQPAVKKSVSPSQSSKPALETAQKPPVPNAVAQTPPAKPPVKSPEKSVEEPKLDAPSPSKVDSKVAPKEAPKAGPKKRDEQAKPSTGPSKAEVQQVAREAAEIAAQATTKKLIAEKTQRLDQQLAVLAKKAGKLGESDKALAEKVNKELVQFREQIASVRADLKQLSTKLASIKAKPLISGKSIAVNALLLGQLEADITAGRAYRAALDRFDQAVKDADVKQLLDGLSPFADNGVPTHLELTKRFQLLARTLSLAPVEPPSTGTPGEGFGDWLWAKIKNLVSVRRVSGPGPIPILSKAEAAIAEGDFQRAADLLEKLAAPGAKPWIKDARAYVASRDIMEKARWHVSGLLRQPPSSKK